MAENRADHDVQEHDVHAHDVQDQDSGKGATEVDAPVVPGNIGMQEQLGHRDQDPMLKDADSDFPEPGRSPEHSGERERKTA